MKIEAFGHSKMKRLSRRLNLPHYAVVGIMESIWQVTRAEAPQGDIGKLSNEDIAIQIGWLEDAERLVDALLGCGWLDAMADDGTHEPSHRLVVHDWSEHAPDTVHSQLARAGLLFADGKRPKLSKLDAKERSTAEERLADAERRRAAPRRAGRRKAAPTLPSHTLPILTPPTGAGAEGRPADIVEFYNRITGRDLDPEASSHEKAIRPRLNDRVRPTTLKLAAIGACLSPHHIGMNEQQTEYLDPVTIFRADRLDGHANRARTATFRIPRGEEVWEYWREKLSLKGSAVMEHFFRARDELLAEEGKVPIGPAAIYPQRFKLGDPWPDPATEAVAS